ncbi:MAG TPA: AI-2E family transporter [Cellvibrionaceae bacterium]
MINKELSSHIASYLLMALALWLVLTHGLLAALLSGMLVYSLVTIFSPRLYLRFGDNNARLIIVSVLGTLIVTALVLIIWSGIAFFKSDKGSAQVLLQKLADIIDASRSQCPEWICANIPDSAHELRAVLTEWLREHAGEAKILGADAGHTIVRVIIGMIVGAMISLNAVPTKLGVLGVALSRRIGCLTEAFKKIVFAQVKISSINAVATGAYILLLLPLFGINLPLAKTLIVLTFLLGMMPIIGNLMSNTMLVIITLPFGLMASLGSLLFLIVLHKLEYFLNAKIIGQEIKSNAWELLIAAIVMESIFGLPGVVMAPILYAYIKHELIRAKLV